MWLKKKTVQSEYPVGRSHPAPLAAPPGSLPGLSPRSDSSLQTGFSLRSAGRAVTSAATGGQSEANRKSSSADARRARTMTTRRRGQSQRGRL